MPSYRFVRLTPGADSGEDLGVFGGLGIAEALEAFAVGHGFADYAALEAAAFIAEGELSVTVEPEPAPDPGPTPEPPPEPTFIRRHDAAHTLTPAELREWFRTQALAGSSEGVGFARYSVSHDGRLALMEGWLEQPGTQGAVRWHAPATPPGDTSPPASPPTEG